MIENFEADRKAFEEKAYRIDTRQAWDEQWDELYDAMTNAMADHTMIFVEHCMHNDHAIQPVLQFVSRYRKFVEYCHIDGMQPDGACYIKLKHTFDLGEQKDNYSDLQSAYTEEYYLTDCGGYELFMNSNGRKLNRHLPEVLNIVDPQPGEKILDIGCGRGELSFAMAQKGAQVTGVDYSEDAIVIASRTFKSAGRGLLSFQQEDILAMQNLDVYDKMIMADVVEHIEQGALERIFEKLARSLSDNGLLIIHTAPNRNYNERVYPARRAIAKLAGGFLPREPRTYYEKAVHINEQTPEGLYRTLSKYFPHVKVWTGAVTDASKYKTSKQKDEDNKIFACAAKNRAVLNRMIRRVSKQPLIKDYDLRISAPDLSAACGQTVFFEATVENRGKETLSSYINRLHATYHILDKSGQTVVFDGVRSLIEDDILPGTKATVPMRVYAPSSLPEGAYTVRLTGVLEGFYWLDREGKNYTDIFLTVHRRGK